MSTDKKTIGLSLSNKALLMNMMERDWFKDQMDAAKFAMSFAIRTGVPPIKGEQSETVWNVGSLDSSGELRTIISALTGEMETPYRLAEQYMNAGIEHIGLLLEKKPGTTIEELMDIAEKNVIEKVTA
jgi:hypothetical protein